MHVCSMFIRGYVSVCSCIYAGMCACVYMYVCVCVRVHNENMD